MTRIEFSPASNSARVTLCSFQTECKCRTGGAYQQAIVENCDGTLMLSESCGARKFLNGNEDDGVR